MKLTYTFLVILLVSMFGQPLMAQEVPVSTWPASNRIFFDNPALAGYDSRNHLYLGTYQKWIGVEGAPSTSFLGASIPVKGRLIGLGGLFLMDRTGLINQTRVSLFAAAHTPARRDHRISFGAMASFHNLNILEPNVADNLVGASGLNGSKISIGMGLNYRASLGDENSWLNVQLLYPQFSTQLLLNTGGDVASYSLGQQFILQANLSYPFGNGNQFTPSIRTHFFKGKANEWKALVDAGLGFAFKEGAFRVKAGYRNAQASMAYLSFGFELAKMVDIYIQTEPIGPLGRSFGADAGIAFGNSDSLPWHGEEFWQNELEEKGLSSYFNVSVEESSSAKEILVSYSLDDSDDLLYNLQDDKLLKVGEFIDELNKVLESVNKGNGQVLELDFFAQVKKDLDDDLPRSYDSSAPVDIQQYFKEGVPRKLSVEKGDPLSQAELAAIKLHHLQRGIMAKVKETIPSNVYNISQLNVEQDESIDYNRRISVKLKIRK